MRKKNYSFLLMAVLLLISGNMWANLPQLDYEPQGYAFNPDASSAPAAAPRRAAMAATQQVRLQYAEVNQVYDKLQDAFTALPANSTPATVTLESDVYIDYEGACVTLEKYHHVTLDLNGFSIFGLTSRPDAHSAVILNKGTLVVEDNSVAQTGAIYNQNTQPDNQNAVGVRDPRFAYNVITNSGDLTINGGLLQNNTAPSADNSIACYCVDNQTNGGLYTVRLTINGGHLYNYFTQAIRMFCNSTTNSNEVIVNGGSIEGFGAIWMQNPSSSKNGKGSLTINGGTFTTTAKCYAQGTCQLKETTSKLYNDGTSDQFRLIINGGVFNENVNTQGKAYVEINGGTFNANYISSLSYRHISGGTYEFILPDVLTYVGYRGQAERFLGSYTLDVLNNTYNYYTKEQLEEQGYVVKDYHEYNAGQPAGQFWAIYSRSTSRTDFYNDRYQWIKDGYCVDRVSDADPNDYTCRVLPCSKTSTDEDGNWANGETWGGEENIPTPSTNATVEHEVTINSGNAEANKIEVTNEGQIIVATGATLNVGNGGIVTNNAVMDPVIVEAGGTLIVGGQGISNTGTKDLVIEADDANGSGVLVFNPNTTIASTQAKATVNLHTYCKKVDDQYYFQLFGTPVTGLSNTNKPTTSVATTTYMYMWDYEGQQAGWRQLTDWAQLNTPFAGYNVTNTSNGNIIYTFRGDLIGNGNQQLVLPHEGYCVMGNSYTAPIDVRALFAQIDNDMNQNQSNSPIEKTVYVYNAAEGQYMYTNELGLTLEELGIMQAPFNRIQPMQGFLLNLQNGESAGTTVNYANAVFNPIVNPVSASAPARSAAHTDMTIAKLSIRGGNFVDELMLVEGSNFSDEVENGMDALKFVDDNNISLYANNIGGKLAMVATDNLEGTSLAFQAKTETTYTISFDRAINCNYALCDYATGQQVAIVEGNTYTFTADANSFNPARFGVVKANKVVTGMDALSIDTRVSGIYTVLGQYLGTAETFNSLPAGVYIVNGAKIVK